MRLAISLFLCILIHFTGNSYHLPFHDKQLLKEANTYFYKEAFNLAEESYKKYLAKASNNLALEEKGFIYNQLLFIGIKEENLEKVKKYLDFLVINEGLIIKNQPLAQKIFTNIGEYFRNNWDGEKAVFYYLKALDLITNRDKESGIKLKLDLYAKLGYCQRNIIGNTKKAAVYFEKEESLLLEYKEQYSPLTSIKNKYNLASCFRSDEEYGRAKIYANSCLEEIEKFQPKNISFKVKCLMLIANIKGNMGDLNGAIEDYLRNLNLIKNLESEKRNLAYYYNNLGRFYFSVNNYKAASTYFKKINSVTKNLDLLIEANIGISECQFQQGKLSLAELSLKKLLWQINNKKGSIHPATSRIHEKIGDYHSESLKLDSALVAYQKAINSLSSSVPKKDINQNPSPEELIYSHELEIILLKKAKVLRKRYETFKNIRDLNLSLDIFYFLEKNRFLKSDFLQEEGTLHFLEFYHETTIEAIKTILLLPIEFQDNHLLFSYFEKVKSNLLLKTLREMNWNYTDLIPDSLIRKKTQIDRKINELKNVSPSSNGKKELIEFLKEKQIILELINKRFPEYTQLSKTQIPLKKYQKWLEINQAQTIHYLSNRKDLIIAFIDSDKTIFKYIPLDSSFAKQVLLLKDLLQNKNPLINPKKVFQAYCENAFSLYQLLINPVANVLTPNKNLIIIPDGKLTETPFDALISEEPTTTKIDYKNLNYFIREFDIRFAFSASTLHYQETTNKPKTLKKIVGLSYSDHETLKNWKLKTTNFPELPSSIQETKILFQNFKHLELKTLIGVEASKDSFLGSLNNADLIHLATHATADKVNGKNNLLIFRDGRHLSSSEIINIPFTTRLITLSACETGVGKFYEGEGNYSLARSFCIAGIPTVIMSLWKVNDNSMEQIFQNFYSYLDYLPISTSLRQAKLDFLDNADEIIAYPGNWASLQVIGINTPFKLNNIVSNNIQYIILCLFLFIIIIGLKINI